MVAHADFIYRLVDLVEYAKVNDLMVAFLALNAAFEVITPSIDKTVSDKINAPCVTQVPRRPTLRVIAGGLSNQTVDWTVAR
jgi:hypothetical protein